MRETGGRSSGFDYLRLCLACSIIVWHCVPIAEGPRAELALWHGPAGVVMHLALPMFFALSGFLVAGSLQRCPSLISFYGLRALRIVPALAVEITLSALVLGPLLTTLSLRDYATNPEFARYFLNILGDVHFHLPGVFANNPTQLLVNGQLWTIPFELQCYVAIGVLAAIGAVRNPWLLTSVTVFGALLWAFEATRRGGEVSTGAAGPCLVVSFLAGLLLYHWRDRILLGRWPAIGALALCLAVSALPHGAYYLPLPCAYLTVALGLCNPPRIRLVSGGDYSYGLYLYGYPIQQSLAAILPSQHSPILILALALPTTFAMAFISWHVVEKRALGWRRYLPALEARVLAATADGALRAA
jgi:peptidoglycan/LPS O-acetylase OafA/YrhL